MHAKYLDPAYSLIMKFAGPSGRLSKGIDNVAAVAGVDRTRVYRWMRPREKGGTGGLIPTKQQMKLLEHAQGAQLPVGPSDFFGSEARAA